MSESVRRPLVRPASLGVGQVVLIVSAVGLVACNENAAHDGCSDPDGRTYRPELGVQTVQANGLQFAYFEEGQGPLVLLLHGFPDTPHGFDDTRRVLATAGYRAVSPFMRGYAPTEIPSGDDFGANALGRDVLALIEALGEESAILVGHDWGAFAAYAAVHLDPSRVGALVAIATPHPAGQAIDESFFRRAPHFLYLVGENAEDIMRTDDFAHVDILYARWAPTWNFDPSETAPVKNVFSAPGSLMAALGYYRAIQSLDPTLFMTPTAVPALMFSGRDDRVLLLASFEGSAIAFTGTFQLESIDGGHFLHRENPDLVNPIMLEFLAAHAAR